MPKFIAVFLFIFLVSKSYSQNIRIVQNSRLAKLVGRMSGERGDFAVTIGKTIFVSCKGEEFLARPWWVKHEFEHVRQYEKHGILGFLQLYLFYSMRYGYYEIPFEKNAVEAEFSDE